MKTIKIMSLLVPFIISACSPGTPDTPAQISIEVLSNQPYLLSDSNALIKVSTDVADAADLRVLLNNLPVNIALSVHERDDEFFTYLGLINELAQGENTLQISAGSGAAQLTLMNYPRTGPIFSGEQQSPYFCLSQLSLENGKKRQFVIGNGDYLDDSATDAFCSLPTRVDYVYRSNDSANAFVPLESGDMRPSDLAFTTTSDSKEVPYIVRIETGTINRAIYQIATLHDPREAAPTALAPSTSWNQRLVYVFGGGCEAGYFQGTSTGGVLRDTLLSKGYAVASSTLNVNSQGGCNDVLSAETAMMVKEHYIEQYGLPLYTIGNGASGGAMQQLLIAGAYPGILDGIIPSMTFSDAVSYMTDSEECAKPLRRFLNDPSRNLPDSLKASIGGWPTWDLCNVSLGERPDRIAPDGCSDEIPIAQRYDPNTNPEGVRCSIYDGMRNVFGEEVFPELNSQRQIAVSPHDNVGVQYGLAALNEGLIDKTLFLDLNEEIGGWNIDFQLRPERTVGNDDAIRIAYETGRVTNGAAGLSMVPIIDDRPYLDHVGNFHASVYSFTTRARLLRDNGHADNYVIRRHFREHSLEEENLALMDQWLARLTSDHSDRPLLEKIVEAKPDALQDDCFDQAGQQIVEPAIFDEEALFDNSGSRCNQIFPPHAGLRLVAGGPLTNDVLKCELKPVDYRDYKVDFDVADKSRLKAIFPTGVCDWTKLGVHQGINQTWLSFGPSPVNLYLP